MIRLVRIVWFASCPLLAVAAAVHVPLERFAAAEIEHNVDIEAWHRGSATQTPDCDSPTNAVTLPGSAPFGCVSDVLGRRTASGLVFTDTRTAVARAITIPKTVRLLV